MTLDTKKLEKRFAVWKMNIFRGINAVQVSLDVSSSHLVTSKEKSHGAREKIDWWWFDSILFQRLSVLMMRQHIIVLLETDYSFRNFRDDYYTNQIFTITQNIILNRYIHHAETSLYCLCSGKDRELIWKGYIDSWSWIYEKKLSKIAFIWLCML
jgi:hypothetical protein